VVVISPPDVSLTGSVYDFTRGLGFYLGPGLACRAAPGSPPPGAAPSLADPHSLYGRASRIMLNGVSVARLTLEKPPAVMTLAQFCLTSLRAKGAVAAESTVSTLFAKVAANEPQHDGLKLVWRNNRGFQQRRSSTDFGPPS
jgi:hypothetical protein